MIDATAASAQDIPENSYLRIFGGATSAIGDGDGDGPIGGLAFGMRPGPTSPWRSEIELSRRLSDSDSAELSATGVMFNVIRDVGEAGSVTTYIGAGIGALDVTASDAGGSGQDIAVAGQVFLGAEIPLGAKTGLTIEGRYVDAGDRPGTATGDARWADLTAGLIFNF